MTKDLTDSCFYSEPKSKDKSLVDKLQSIFYIVTSPKLANNI